MENIICICSSCNEYADYLNKNIDISPAYLQLPWKWVVAFNEQPKIGGKILSSRFNKIPFITNNQQNKHSEVAPGSIEHGLNLNALVKYAKQTYNCRFIFLLDPDFFVFYDLSKIIQKMLNTELAIFGASYGETSHAIHLIPNVPVAFCMIIDLLKYPDINCSPGKQGIETNYYPDVGFKMYSDIKTKDRKFYDFASPVVYCDKWPHEKHSQGLKELYNIEYQSKLIASSRTKIDEYFYKGEFFGIHLRGKLFKSKNRQQFRIDYHLQLIQKLKEVFPCKLLNN